MADLSTEERVANISLWFSQEKLTFLAEGDE
jgi:hypothetical protein